MPNLINFRRISPIIRPIEQYVIQPRAKNADDDQPKRKIIDIRWANAKPPGIFSGYKVTRQNTRGQNQSIPANLNKSKINYRVDLQSPAKDRNKHKNHENQQDQSPDYPKKYFFHRLKQTCLSGDWFSLNRFIKLNLNFLGFKIILIQELAVFLRVVV